MRGRDQPFLRGYGGREEKVRCMNGGIVAQGNASQGRRETWVEKVGTIVIINSADHGECERSMGYRISSDDRREHETDRRYDRMRG